MSISLFHGWMRAFKLDRSGNEKSWSAKNRVYKSDEIREALKEAVKTTDSRGNYARIIIDHGQMRHKTIDLPPMNSKDLHTYIVRKVDQLKEFNEEAAFCYTKASTKNRVFVSINYIPMSFIKELMQACMDAGLYLTQLIPLSRVRSRQFCELPIIEDELAALVVNMFDNVSLVIGNKEGLIFSERRLKAVIEDDEDIERIVKEVNRSILYNKQQFGQRITAVKLSERFGEKFFQYLNKNLNISVEWLPESPRFFWNKEVLSISFDDGGNLLARNVRSEMKIRKNTKAAALMVIALWIGVISTSIGVEYLIYKERQLHFPTPAKSQIKELQNTKDELGKRAKKLNQLSYAVKVLEEERLPPVPGWFLGHLCNELPNGLVLTKARIQYKEDKWEVLIEGISTNENRVEAKKLKMFSHNLQNGPFQLQVKKSWYEDWLKQLREGNKGNDRTKKFSIGGMIR